jgi:hypothetical protein
MAVISRRLAILVFGAVVVILGCGNLLEIPDWEVELWLRPGVYTHMREDSLSIRYRCVVNDRVGDPPGSVALLEVEDPGGGVTALGEEYFGVAWVPAAWDSTDSGYEYLHWAGYPGYSLTEGRRTIQSGTYVWRLVDIDGNGVIVEDSLVASPLTWDVDQSKLYPSDSSRVGEDILFHWPSAGSEYAYTLNLHGASDELIFSLDTPDSLVIIPDHYLTAGTWYWWSLQLWDLREDNCWESDGRRWLFTSE